jgi:hypothetical protein
MSQFPTPAELDSQSKVHIDKWLDVDSLECRELDDNHAFAKKCIRLGFQEPAYLFTDSLGRIFGKGENGYYYPFYFTSYGKNIGYRLSKTAAN